MVGGSFYSCLGIGISTRYSFGREAGSLIGMIYGFYMYLNTFYACVHLYIFICLCFNLCMCVWICSLIYSHDKMYSSSIGFCLLLSHSLRTITRQVKVTFVLLLLAVTSWYILQTREYGKVPY